MVKLIVSFAATVLFALLTLPLSAACPAPAWGYQAGPTGPDNWGNLDLDFASCSAGRAQSPVRIVINDMRRNNGLPLLQFNNPAAQVRVRNTGHEIKVYPATTTPPTLIRGGQTGTLVQFHFHVKAEHLENDVRHAGEVHFVYQFPNNKIVVVAVWLYEAGSNDNLATILANKPQNCGVSGITPATVSIWGFMKNVNHYATYEGSLTTPPCGEGVTFIMLLEGMPVHRDQIAALRLVSTGDGNARPARPLNGRVIEWRQMP